MALVDRLPEIKEHLRTQGAGEDSLLLVYAGAALEYIRAFTRRPWPVDEEWPASIRAALLLIVGDLYENREAQSSVALRDNRTVDRLLWPHRAF